jgi:ABC-2 type transport system permease protein
LAVGLGARLPNLREISPARIAAGFGGTLTLILSALFVLLVVLPPAFPAYLLAARQSHSQLLQHSAWMQAMPKLLWLCVAHSLLLTTVVTVGSLRMGIRAFDRMEMQ